jgi:hypothetical protein
MVNYDLTWNPMVLEQRIGRIDRIGQAKTEIHIYNLIVEGSIDEWIIRTLGRKLGLVEGSVLEPASVLERSPVQRLFFDRNLREEVGHADALANAMELSSTVIPEDYQLAALIDSTFCDVGLLRRAATKDSNLPWVREGRDSRAVLKNIARVGARLQSRINLYSA